VYPSAPHWLFELQVTFEHEPFKHTCPVGHVFFNLAVELFEQLELTVPGLEQVYVV
jgi:hypothetical protein